MALTDKLKAIADAIRGKTGKTAGLTLEQMATEQDAVFDAGKQAEYDRFWDSFQGNGVGANYNYRFSMTWNDVIYRPKYPIKINTTGGAQQIFYYSKVTNTIVDIVALTGVNFYGTFMYARALVTIPRLVVTNTSYFNNAFRECFALENLNIEGVLGGAGFDVSDSTKLTHDSLMSIINALETKNSGTHTCTLGATNLAKLTAAEKAIATGKGWTLA